MNSRMLDLNTLSLPDLYEELTRSGLAHRLFSLARDEDLVCYATGVETDLTSELYIDEDSETTAMLRSRGAGVVAGLAAAPELLSVFTTECEFLGIASDGDTIEAGAALGEVSGPTRQVLRTERALLNLVSRLSGVATFTNRFVRAIEATGADAMLYDTRKTTPGLRILEKYAVRCGGGMCHRIGLHDAVMIKDNHLAGVELEGLADRIAAAARRALDAEGGVRFVEVEVDSLAQFEQVLRVEAELIDIVMLDNMAPDSMREAVRLRDEAGSEIQLEASGGVTLESVDTIAKTGVDRISVGSITQSAPALDIGLDIE
ncbi:MAG: carboxylating nicotinate-nucleotide diphosphorylase [Phycisphaeraceae bacterium]|nr:MAG: carboxylating nicotinate-nucleotide diphosphorylase [Phycisphaeraceae bacterium]